MQKYLPPVDGPHMLTALLRWMNHSRTEQRKNSARSPRRQPSREDLLGRLCHALLPPSLQQLWHDHPLTRSLQLEAFEDRLLYNAAPAPAPAPVAAEVAVVAPVEAPGPSAESVPPPASSAPDNLAAAQSVGVLAADPGTTAAGQSTGSTLIVVDPSVPDYEALLNLLTSQQSGPTDLLVLDSQRDGLQQIAERLEQLGQTKAIHILSHGDEAGLHLGSNWLSTDTINQRASTLSEWQPFLTADADVLFYGCDLAANATGQAFLRMFGELTGTDVAASTNPTGAVARGGDWTLEFQSGSIETPSLGQQFPLFDWNGLLTSKTYQQGGASYTGTQDTAISATTPGTPAGATSTVSVGGAASSTGLLRFDSLFGSGPNQIPLGSTILSASLQVNVTSGTSVGSTISLHRVLTNWSEASTWNTLGSGLSRDNNEVATVADALVSNSTATGLQTISGLEQSLQAWSNGETNLGWALFGDNATAWTITSSEGATVALRPLLIVDYSAPVVASTEIRATDEFRVNTTTINTQSTAERTRGSHDAVGVDANGNYVVVWTSDAQDGSGSGIFAQRYNARGLPLGTEFRVNQTTANNQDGAAVAMKSDGGFIVTWTSLNQDGSGQGVNARIFDSQGNGGSEFRVNTTTSGIQQSPAIGVAADGTFVIAWEGNGSGDTYGIFAQRFDAGGGQQNGEFRINATTTNGQYDPAIAVGQDGQFMVVWDDAIGTHGRRFNSSGTASDASDLLLHADYTSGNADVATNGTGSYHIVWRTTGGGDGSGRALWKMELGATDTTPQPLEQVTISTINSQTEPSITSDGNGDFIVTWQGSGLGDTDGVFARKFNSQGIPIGDEFLLNQTTFGSQVFVSAAMVDLNNFVAVWSGNGPGDPTGIYARAFGTLPNVASLLFSTNNNVVGSGNPDLSHWKTGDVLTFGAPNLSLGTNTTGQLSLAGSLAALGDGDVKIEGLDVVRHDILVGATTHTVQLLVGDVLFSVGGTETFGGLTVQRDDVVGFRAAVAGSYASGSFFIVFQGMESVAGGAIAQRGDYHLIEQATRIGDVVVQAGDLVISDIGGGTDSIVVFRATGAGVGFTSGAVSTLLNGSEINLSRKVWGLEVIEQDTTVGGLALHAGDLLVSLDSLGTIGSNLLSVTGNDVARLVVSQTSVNGPASVTASLLLQGADIALNTGNEAFHSLALTSTGTPPTAQGETYTLTEDQTLNTANQWYDANWSSRMQLTFDNSTRAENLSDFPVLVTLDANRFDYALAQSNGADLRFVDPNGQVLSYEIETWNPSGRSTIWVKVPQIDASSNTDSIWMYYGNTTAPAAQNPTAVWSNGYVGVWHMNGNPAGTLAIQDSTASNKDGTSIGMDATNEINGPIGGALNFNGTNEAIRINSTGSDPLAIDGNQMTIESWANSTGSTGNWETIINRREYFLIFPADAYGLMTTGTDPTALNLSAGFTNTTGTTGTLPDDRWRYVTGVVSGTTATLYVDGQQNATHTLMFPLSSSADDVTIGAGENGYDSTLSEYWKGGIDEVRISNIARSAAWTAAQYASMTDTLISYGDRQTVAGLLDNDHSVVSGGLTVSRVDLSDLTGTASAVVLDNGQLMFTPGASFQTLAAGQTATKQINYTVTDALGNTAQATATIIIQGVNDAPVINTVVGPLTLTSVLEDATSPAGDTVAAIITSAGGTLISDVDAGALPGIAVTAADTTHGTWEFSANGTTWSSLSGVSDTNATLLDTTSHVRFVPTAGFSGPAGSLTFRAWDQTSGTNTQTGVNVSIYGGTTAFSTQSTTASITVTHVNVAPVITTNAGMTVAEGGTRILNNEKLAASDPDNTAAQLVYTVTTSPTNGRLEKSTNAGVAITTFTQADINGGLIRYVHDGGETTSDGFSFSLSDGAATVTGSFAITVTPVNDAPVIGTNTPLTVAEGGNGLLTNAVLSASDVDNTPAQLVYSLTTSPAHGRLERVSAGGTAITSFTQADLNSGAVRYVHDGSETTSDGFSFSLSDGAATVTGSFAITVTPVNDPPVLAVNAGLTVLGGGNGVLTNTKLSASDPDNTATQLVYTLSSSLSHGRLERVVAPGVPITTFTQADLNSNAIRYVHDGGETTSDGFSFSLSDGAATVTGSFAITVTPVNDPPVATTQPGLTVLEGGTVVIPASKLSTTDPDNGAASLTYTVTGGLGYGHLAFVSTPVTAITSFTQSQVNASQIVYVHGGAESTAEYFTFSVSDGALSTTGTLSLTITPVNDPPVMANHRMTISEGQTHTLTTFNLLTNDPDSPATSLVYTVNSVTQGRFEWAATPGTAITAFTQDDINNARVRFVHNGGEAPPTARLSVSDGFVTIGPKTMNMTFSNVNDPPLILPATFAVPENSPNGQVVGQVQWSDPDVGDTHTFSIQPGPSSSLFSINAVTGEILVADGSHLDYEVATSHDLQVQIADQSGATAQATIHIDVLNVNETPVALGFPPVNGTENGPLLTIDLKTGFHDPESAPLNFQIVSMTNPVLFSSAQINPAGVLALAGAAQSYGACSITVQATDPFGLSATTTIEVVLAPLNSAPIAVADSLTSPISSAVVISPAVLLANDTDADHDPLTLSITKPPSHGTLVANADGTLTYQPNLGYSGTDSFEYTASDGTASSAPAVVSLNIAAIGPGFLNPASSATNASNTSNTSNSSSATSSNSSGNSSTTSSASTAPTSPSTPPAVAATVSASPTASAAVGTPFGSQSNSQDKDLTTILPKGHEDDRMGQFLNHNRPVFDDVSGPSRSADNLDAMSRRLPSGELAFGSLGTSSMDRPVAQFDFPVSARLSQLRAILASNANQSAFAEVTKSLKSDLTSELVFEVPALAGASLTVGYVVWMLRGGILISSLLAQMPAWSMVDPLTVLDSLDQSDEDDESLGSLMEQGQSEFEPML